MRSFKATILPLLLLLLLLSILLSVTALASQDHDRNGRRSDPEEFQKMLAEVSEERLHAALHDYSPSKFKHGVFQKDRTAVEQVHRDDAAEATRLIRLAKRQGGVSNSTSTTSTPSSSPSQSSNLSTSTTSTAPSTTPTSSETPTSSKVSLTSFTSKVLSTVTGTNGQPSTVTQFTIVGATARTPSGSAGASNTASGSVSLQTNGAFSGRSRMRDLGVLAGGAALGLVML